MVILTIITPAYQAANWLEACIENVASEHCDRLEHIIVDGGSRDGSVEILQNLAARYDHVRWISEKDKGQSDAMNKGLRMAKGKWVCFLNADDFFEDGALASVLNHIQKDPDRLCLLLGNLKVWNENGMLISVNKPSSMSLPRLLADMCEWPYNPSAYFYPKSVHDKIGYFPEEEHFAMDYDFILRLMAARIPVEYHAENWGNFRLLPQAKTGRDQASSDSFYRAEKMRRKYFQQAGVLVKLETQFLRLLWAVRNKLLGIFRKLNRQS